MLSKNFRTLALTSLLVFMVGCRPSPYYSSPGLNAAALKPTLTTAHPLHVPMNGKLEVSSPLTSTAGTEPTGEITLREVLALALLQNPALAAFSHEIRAREAAILQAGLLPNPRLSAQGSNLANTALRERGIDDASTTVQLSQLILANSFSSAANE